MIMLQCTKMNITKLISMITLIDVAKIGRRWVCVFTLNPSLTFLSKDIMTYKFLKQLFPDGEMGLSYFLRKKQRRKNRDYQIRGAKITDNISTPIINHLTTKYIMLNVVKLETCPSELPGLGSALWAPQF